MSEKKNDFLEKNKEYLSELQIEERQEQLAKAKEEEMKESEENMKEEVLNIIFKEHPEITKEKIEEWKGMYFGKVFITRFDEREAYIYRYITAPAYKRAKKTAINSKVPEELKQELLEELIFDECVLYPKLSPDDKLVLPAGTISTIANNILLSSNFVSEKYAVQLMQQL